jgi:hypothetical protein
LSARSRPGPRPSRRPAPTPQRSTTGRPPRPIQTLWTLALNNQLTVAPAYEKERAFFAIAGDRIVAYDLSTGKQLWPVTAKPQMDLIAGDGLLFFPRT